MSVVARGVGDPLSSINNSLLIVFNTHLNVHGIVIMSLQSQDGPMVSSGSPSNGAGGLGAVANIPGALVAGGGNNGGNEGSHSMSPKTKRLRTEYSSNEDVEGNDISSMADNYGHGQHQAQHEDSDNDISNTDPEGFFYSGQESPSKYYICLVVH